MGPPTITDYLNNKKDTNTMFLVSYYARKALLHHLGCVGKL